MQDFAEADRRQYVRRYAESGRPVELSRNEELFVAFVIGLALGVILLGAVLVAPTY